nr:solute carrier family 26 member 6-like [Onthophagus taurus]
MGDVCKQIKIERPLYEQAQLHDELEYHKSKKTLFQKFCSNCKNSKPKKILYKTIPALDWLIHYKWKENLSADLIAGFTVAIMHIPQGMAYGLLGNVDPVIGIYMAFFPVLMYVLLGTSRHNSLGTFAVVCLMTGKVVLEHSNSTNCLTKNSTEIFNLTTPNNCYSPIQVATAVTFMTAIFQLMMYALRLGVISNLISETMVSGFTTGAAVHVLTSQVKDLFGYVIPKHKGLFTVVNTYISLFAEITHLNFVATLISVVTIGVMLFNNEILKPKVAKLCSFPIPIELMVIVFGTLISYLFSLNQNNGIKIVGEVPKGLPFPMAPPFSLMNEIMLDSFIIAVVSYTINLSMGMIFAQKLGYEVDANQELLAQGVGNMFGSFFQCMPYTASLSRSVIQQTVGGRTQLASLVSCSLLVIVLMWIGPFFEPLPRCVLASTIIVALKSMLFQIKDFFKFFKLSKMDAMVWLSTFLSVVFIGIDVGLLIGFIMSLLSIFFLTMKPYTCLLGSVPQTDLYLDINRYKGAQEIAGLKIFHYQGGVNFATKNFFRSELYRLIEMDPQKELIRRKKLTLIDDKSDKFSQLSPTAVDKMRKKQEKLKSRSNSNVQCVILDFSALSYIDPSGASMLNLVCKCFNKVNVPVFIAGCSAPVYETLLKCGLIETKRNMFRIFPTTHDAVQFAVTTQYFNEATIPTVN